MSDTMQNAADRSQSLGAEIPRPPNLIDAKHEPYRIYHVLGEDNTTIEQTAREVAEGSKLLSNLTLWRSNFIATIGKVRSWCDEKSSVLRAALVDVRSNKILLYFVPNSDSYDLDLGGAMTNLEVELGSAGIGYVESLQVPSRSLVRFVGPRSLVVWQRAGENLFAEAAETPTPS